MAKNKDGVILTGDGRCDSPGYSAKFGSYTIIEQQINRVLDFQLVQVKCRNVSYLTGTVQENDYPV